MENQSNAIKIKEDDVHDFNEIEVNVPDGHGHIFDKYRPIKNMNLKFLNNLHHLMFLFVNPISGAKQGVRLLELIPPDPNNSGLRVMISREKPCVKQHESISVKNETENAKSEIAFIVFAFDLIDTKDKQKGLQLLKEYTYHYENEAKLKVLVAGGDGTVLSWIGDMHLAEIDLQRCIFAHVPLGTGNDLSNALGFGSQVSLSDASSLEAILLRYSKSQSTKVDVWELTLFVHREKGEILRIKNGKTPLLDSENNPIRVYKKPFINYMSLGYDARVGFGFEKSRSGSRCCNKCIYFWEGCKKNCCRKTLPLDFFLESFKVLDRDGLKEEHQRNNTINSSNSFRMDSNIMYSEMQNPFKTRTIFQTKHKNEKKEKLYKFIALKGNPVTLVCQNINFYMGGTKDIWKKSGAQIGLKVYNDSKGDFDKDQLEEIAKSEQRFDDHKLEFFTYSSGFKIGFEKISTGQADKIYHGPGPIIMKFKDTPEKSQDDKYKRVYLNVDGEYFHIVKPLELRIKLNKKICKGSVNFMVCLG